MDFVLDTALVRDYKQQLEDLLPFEIDAIESEGEMLVQYIYVKDSLEFKGLVDVRLTDPIYPITSAWKYFVRSAWADKDEMFDTLFIPSSRLAGLVYIPIDTDFELVLEDVDFLEGLKFVSRS